MADVDIIQSGRGGTIYYREGANVALFDWEFAGGNALALIFGTKAEAWDRAEVQVNAEKKVKAGSAEDARKILSQIQINAQAGPSAATAEGRLAPVSEAARATPAVSVAIMGVESTHGASTHAGCRHPRCGCRPSACRECGG